MTNPLLADWDTPFQIAPFDKISDDDFAPALDAALASHAAEIAVIAGATDAPSFANTVEALEAVGKDLDKVLGTFYTVAGADSNPAREALQRDFSPKLAAHFSEISANKALFQRVASVWNERETLDLTDEQARVLMQAIVGLCARVRPLRATRKIGSKRSKRGWLCWAHNSRKTCWAMNANGSWNWTKPI